MSTCEKKVRAQRLVHAAFPSRMPCMSPTRPTQLPLSPVPAPYYLFRYQYSGSLAPRFFPAP